MDTLNQLAAHFYLPLPFMLWPLPFALPFWAIYVWTRYGERKVLLRKTAGGVAEPKSATVAVDDKGSWAVIDYGSKGAKIAALIAAFVIMPVEGPARIWLYVTGLLMMVAGSLLRRYCFHLLGRYFTFRVSVSEKNEIIKEGIYKWVRHPSYTGGILYNVGIGCALTNLVSIFFLAMGMVLVYVYRVRVEEEALIRAHGSGYSEYMTQTKRFIPFVF